MVGAGCGRNTVSAVGGGGAAGAGSAGWVSETICSGSRGGFGAASEGG